MNENSEKHQEQEVDLIPVFTWIGNGFRNVGRGIGNFFSALGHFLVLFLIFIKNHIILLSALFLIGAGLGIYLDQQSKKTFTAEVRVRPYFDSNTQLISNIAFYNSLVLEENYSRLAKELKMSLGEVESINGFEIEADFNDTELLMEYDELARSADSVALVNYSFKGFKNSKRTIDYQYYNIAVTGTDRDVLEKVAVNAAMVKDNIAIQAERTASIENIDFEIEANKYQLTELDSIISSYQKAIHKAKAQETGVSTNLYMGDRETSTSIKDLFDQKAKLIGQLNSARLKKNYYKNTINIVSSYVKKGAMEKPHYKIKLALAFFGLGLLIALVPVLWRFLNNYDTSPRRKS